MNESLLFLTEVVPQLQHTGELKIESGHSFNKPLHNHPERIEILLLCSGTGLYKIGGQSYQVPAKSLVIYNAGIWHEESSQGSSEHVMLFVRFSNLKLHGLPFGSFINACDSPVITLHEHFYPIEHRFREIVKKYKMDTPESVTICNHLLVVLLAELINVVHHKVLKNNTSSPSRIAEVVIAFIQENYARQITLQELANETYLSPYYLCRRYKEETGMTPFQYLISYRMEVAMYYLRNTNEKIQNIATLVGYSSDTHFQVLFRRTVGITPGQYRILEKNL